MVSDNVFVGTVYINEVKTALINGAINREHFDLLAVAINTGTNLPSVATPNGQAAFLFMLTSALLPAAPLLWPYGLDGAALYPGAGACRLFLRGTAPRSCNRMVLSGRVVAGSWGTATAHPVHTLIMKGCSTPFLFRWGSALIQPLFFSERSII